MEIILKRDTCVPVFVYLVSEKRTPKHRHFPRNLVLGKGKGSKLTSMSGGLISWKEISHHADNPPDYLAGGTGTETTMGQ